MGLRVIRAPSTKTERETLSNDSAPSHIYTEPEATDSDQNDHYKQPAVTTTTTTTAAIAITTMKATTFAAKAVFCQRVHWRELRGTGQYRL